MLVGERIRERRIQLGMSQSQLAGQDMTRAYISQIETGLKKPSDRAVATIAFRLHVSPELLLCKYADSYEFDSILSMAYAEFESNHYENCLTILNKISNDPFVPARLRGHISLLAGRSETALHNYLDALDWFDQSLSLFSDNRVEYTEVLFRKANVYYFMCDFRKGLHYYERVVELCTKHKRLHAVFIQANIFLGTCYFRCGMTPEAQQSYMIGLREAESVNDHRSKIDAMLGLGWVYFHMRMVTQAFDLTNDALKLSRCHEKDYKRVELSHNLAIYHKARREFVLARHVLGDCMRFYENTKNYHALVAAMEEMAEIHLCTSDLSHAEQTLKNALEILQECENPLLSGRVYRVSAHINDISGNSCVSEAYQIVSDAYFRICGAERDV